VRTPQKRTSVDESFELPSAIRRSNLASPDHVSTLVDDSLVEELAWALPDIERHVEQLGPCPQRPVRIPVGGEYLCRSQEAVVSPASDDSLRYPASILVEACCPVCLDELKHRDGRARASCGNCGNELHLKCYTQLVMNREPGTVGVACPMCRQGFDLPGVQEIALMRSLQSTEVPDSLPPQPDTRLDQIVHRLQAHRDALQQIKMNVMGGTTKFGVAMNGGMYAIEFKGDTGTQTNAATKKSRNLKLVWGESDDAGSMEILSM